MTFAISTARLHIRPWTADDRPALEQMAGDTDMMRYVTYGRTWRADEVDEFLERQARHLHAHDCCVGPLLLSETNEIVGISGIQPVDVPGEFELGWWTWKPHWGRGYATEMARALLDYAREVMGLTRIIAVIDPPNGASIRVAEKIGMHFERMINARELVARREDAAFACYAIEL